MNSVATLLWMGTLYNMTVLATLPWLVCLQSPTACRETELRRRVWTGGGRAETGDASHSEHGQARRAIPAPAGSSRATLS